MGSECGAGVGDVEVGGGRDAAGVPESWIGGRKKLRGRSDGELVGGLGEVFGLGVCGVKEPRKGGIGGVEADGGFEGVYAKVRRGDGGQRGGKGLRGEDAGEEEQAERCGGRGESNAASREHRVGLLSEI